VSSSRSSASMSRNTRLIAVRRCFIILLTSRLPASVRLNIMWRRSCGKSRRSSKPARMRRSQMRLAFDALTPKPVATAARFSGPSVSTMTKTRNCGTVTSPSTAAIDAAAMPTSARDARNTASTCTADGPPAAARRRRCVALMTKSSLDPLTYCTTAVRPAAEVADALTAFLLRSEQPSVPGLNALAGGTRRGPTRWQDRPSDFPGYLVGNPAATTGFVADNGSGSARWWRRWTTPSTGSSQALPPTAANGEGPSGRSDLGCQGSVN
jgi:hypothetical protein